MFLTAQILTAAILLLHIYIVLIETVLFDKRGRKVFGLSAEKAAIVKPAMSNQGCYNGFLVIALALGLFYPVPDIAEAFTIYGLSCVLIAGIWGGVTVSKRIALIQAAPAAFALGLYLLG